MQQYIKYVCENNHDRHSTAVYVPLDIAPDERACSECGVLVEGKQDLDNIGNTFYDQITTLAMLSQ